MYIDTTFPPPDGRLAQLMRLVDDLKPKDIGPAVDRLIERLDTLAGDPDLEDSETGDHLVNARGRRLDIPRLGDEWSSDDPDVSWTEWHTRGRQKQAAGGYEPGTVGERGDLHEDDEDDDALEDDDSDRCVAGDDHITSGPVAGREWWDSKWHAAAKRTGSQDDAEDVTPPAWQIDQTAALFVTAANDWPESRA